MTRYLAAALALACLVATAPVPVQAQGGCAVPGDANARAGELLRLTNAARAQQGRQRLGFDRRLAQAAQALACDISRTGRMSHRASDGLNSQGRVRRAGYNDCIVAENLAWGFPEPSRIVSGWLGSAGHNRNMLHPRVREAGIGLAQGGEGPVWVMVYAAEC